MKLLVVEDEPMLRSGLVDLLRKAGHEVEAVADGPSAAARGAEEPFDLVLLDLMLPGLSGVEVCRRLRLSRPALPILALTALGTEEDKVNGLKAGADDYVTKPFGARELLARIEALGRRAALGGAEAERVTVDGMDLDLGRCTATREGTAVALTAREAGILRFLHRNRRRAVTRAELLVNVWGSRGDLETRTVDVTIANLRHKIERDPSRPRVIVSVKKVGYTWGEPDS